MRYFTCLLAALCIAAGMICAQDQPKFSPAQQEVLDAHKARVEAGEKRDYATWSRSKSGDSGRYNRHKAEHRGTCDDIILAFRNWTFGIAVDRGRSA